MLRHMSTGKLFDILIDAMIEAMLENKGSITQDLFYNFCVTNGHDIDTQTVENFFNDFVYESKALRIDRNDVRHIIDDSSQ